MGLGWTFIWCNISSSLEAYGFIVTEGVFQRYKTAFFTPQVATVVFISLLYK